MKLSGKAIVFAALAACFCSCAYFSIGARDNVPSVAAERDQGAGPLYNSAVIMGTVTAKGRTHSTLVMAHPLSYTEKVPGDYVLLARPGSFMLYVPAGRYRIYVFTDSSEDGYFTDEEVSGVFTAKSGQPEEIVLSEGEVRAGVVVAAGETGRGAPPNTARIRIRDDAKLMPYQTANGDIVRIYDEKFCAENAETGLWAPSQFMKAFGAHSYFTRKYDPGKIPILFVHGVEGNPQNWAYFDFRLARTRYQPLYFYYPSGIRLPLATRLLYESLLDLKRKYGIARICVTAHSMGGLIARNLLAQYDLKAQGIEVVLFVTLASPWTGFEAADRAFLFSSKKLPNWYDVGTTSAFIRRTLQVPLPLSVVHCLFYGTKDSISRGRALDDRASAGAAEKFGFDVDHDTILTDRGVFRKYGELLSRYLR